MTHQFPPSSPVMTHQSAPGEALPPRSVDGPGRRVEQEYQTLLSERLAALEPILLAGKVLCPGGPAECRAASVCGLSTDSATWCAERAGAQVPGPGRRDAAVLLLTEASLAVKQGADLAWPERL